MKYLYLFIFLSCFYSQSQESVFYSSEDIETDSLNKFSLKLYNLNFIKNNEYFNFITDGLTLLGTQLHPELTYKNSNKTQFKVGVFLLKNFGEDKIDYAIPTFSFNYINKKHLFTIGNLYARDNHNLIEPLMASEKILTNDIIETGVQYKYKSKNTNFDVWLNWENYIRKYDDQQEVFTLGAWSKTEILNNIFIPIQYVYYHKGGQIHKKYRDDENTGETPNLQNISIGLEYRKLFSENNKFTLGYYYLYHKTDSETEYTFKNGYAHYLTSSYKMNNFQFTVAYYRANKFVTAKGNEMFQSYSLKSNVNYWNGELDNRYVGLTEPDRSVLFSKVFYEDFLSENIKFGLQLEGFYQLNDSEDLLGIENNKKNQFDYSYGIYVVFNEIFNF